MAMSTGARLGAAILGGIGLAVAAVLLVLSWLFGGSGWREEFFTTELPASIFLFGLTLGGGAAIGATLEFIGSRFRR